MNIKRLITAAAGLLACASALAGPEGTAFTYQGRLMASGSPYTGTADFQVSLMDAQTGGSQVGVTATITAGSVNNGLFTLPLDFGTAALDGSARWLQISVRTPSGVGNYVALSPRQSLTVAPYAQYALNSGWRQSGNAITNTNAGGFVGVNRTTPVGPAEFFGVEAPVQSGYGGMYVKTDGAAGLPFYGYVAGNSFAWTYQNGTSGDWAIDVNGFDRMMIDGATGNIGIGTNNPLAPLHVSGSVRVTTGPLIVDGPFSSTNDSISAYAITTGDVINAWNDGNGNAGTFQSHNGNAVDATILSGAGNAVHAVTEGTTSAGHFEIDNAASGAAALEATTNGTGPAARFTGDVSVVGKLSAHLGNSMNRATPIAFGSIDLSAGTSVNGSGNVTVTNLGNDTYRINVSGESSPSTWIVVANVAYSDPVNPDLTFDLRVGMPNGSGQIKIYAPCSSGCGSFTAQSFRVNYTIYKP